MAARTSTTAFVAGVVAAAALAVAGSADAHVGAASQAPEPARFSITIDGYEIASFSEFGEMTPGTVVLRRGSTATSNALRAWQEGVARDAALVMYDTNGRPAARYHLENAWPSKLEIGGLKSGSTEVAVESITLCQEGFEIR